LHCRQGCSELLLVEQVTSFQVPRDGKYKVEIKGYPEAKVKSTKISQHLQIVEIICEDVNGIFVNVLNFLGTLDLCKITINSAFTLQLYVLIYIRNMVETQYAVLVKFMHMW